MSWIINPNGEYLDVECYKCKEKSIEYVKEPDGFKYWTCTNKKCEDYGIRVGIRV